MPTSTLVLAIDASQAARGGQIFINTNAAIQGATLKTNAAVGATETRLHRFGNALRGIGARLGGFFAAFAGVMAVRQAIRTIAEFEDTMVTLRGVAIRTNQSLAEQQAQYIALEATARKLGATTRYTASEVAEGLLFLARAGFSVDQSIKAIPATLNLAQVGMLSLGESADYVSNILSQFRLPAEETVRVVDALVIVSNRAHTDVRQLAQALKFAGPIAGELGVSVEETAAALGVLGDAGIQSTMAGRAMRQELVKLVNPTRDGLSVLKELGLTINDLNPKTSSLTEVFDKLGRAGLTVQQAVKLFSTESATAAIIMSKMAERMGWLHQQTKLFGGEAARQAAMRAKTLTGEFKEMKSAIEELTLAQGDKGLLGFMKEITNSMTLVIRWVSGAEDAVITFKEMWAVLKHGAKEAVSLVQLQFDILGAAITRAFDVVVDSIYRSISWLSSQLLSVLKQIESMVNTPVIGQTLFGSGGSMLVKGLRATVEASGISKPPERVNSWTQYLADAQEKTISKMLIDERSFNKEMERLSDERMEMRRRELLARNKDAIQMALAMSTNIAQVAAGFSVIPTPGAWGGAGPAGMSALDLAKLENQVAETTVALGDFEKRAKSMFFEGISTIGRGMGDLGKTPLSVDIRNETDRLNRLSMDSGLGPLSNMVRNDIARKMRMDALARDVVGVTDQVGDAFGTMAKDMIRHTDSIKNLFRRMLDGMVDSILQKMVAEPISTGASAALSGLVGALGRGIFGGGGTSSPGTLGGAMSDQGLLGAFNSRGNIFAHGSPIPFSRGDVFGSSTYFPMRGGRIGMLGENGWEGILPLGRDSSGRLGVRTTDGRGGSTTVNMTVVTPNAESFRKSGRQIQSEMARRVRGMN